MGKERITLELNSELMDRLRAAGVDPQAYLESVLARKAAAQRSLDDQALLDAAWAEENKLAIEEYNAQVNRIGTFASRQRTRRQNAAS